MKFQCLNHLVKLSDDPADITPQIMSALVNKYAESCREIGGEEPNEDRIERLRKALQTRAVFYRADVEWMVQYIEHVLDRDDRS